MSNLGHQSGSNGEDSEVNSFHEISPNEIAIYIRRMREYNKPVFSDSIDSMSVEEWTVVMSQNFRALFIPNSLRVAIACLFFRGTPTVWIKTVAQHHLFRWNKFRSSLERNFGSFGTPWERRMVNEFRNCTDDSSDGGFGREEGACPFNVPDRETRDDDDDGNDDDNGSDDSNGNDEEDPEEDLEEELDGDKTLEMGIIHEG